MVYSEQDEEQETQDDSADCIYQKSLHGKEVTKTIAKNAEDVGPKDAVWAWKWKWEEKLFFSAEPGI